MNKLLAILSIQAFAFHNNFFGGGKPFAKLDADQLQLIEDALEKTGTSEDASTIEGLQNQVTAFEANETAVEEALTAALELNGMQKVEGQSVTEAIAALGAKCKEYGDSKATHSIPTTTGVERKKNEDDASENYAHNQAFDESKYKTLK